ncbi:MAG: hypothetical protein O7F12_09275 [Nitrospirae bacterium]|nr:hypothetical protein [Nitrospirota bacterium]
MNPLFLAAPIQPASVTEGSHPLASGGNVLTNGEGGNLFASVLAQVRSSTTNQGAQGENQTSSENSDSEQPQLSGQESVGDNQESTLGSEGIVVANAESQQPSPIVTPFIGTPSPLLSTTTESVIPSILLSAAGRSPNFLVSPSVLNSLPQQVGESIGTTIGYPVVGNEKVHSLGQTGQGVQSLTQGKVSETFTIGPSGQGATPNSAANGNVPSGDPEDNVDLLIARPQQPTQDKLRTSLERGFGEERTVGINQRIEAVPLVSSLNVRKGPDLAIPVVPNDLAGKLIGQNQVSPLGLPIHPGLATTNATLASGEGLSSSHAGTVSLQEQAALNQQAFQEKEQSFTGGQPGSHHPHLSATLAEHVETRSSFSQQMEGTMSRGILSDRPQQMAASVPQRLQLDVTLADATKLQIEVAVQQRQVSAHLLLDQMALRNLVLQNQPQLDTQMTSAGLDLKEFGAEVKEQWAFDHQGLAEQEARTSAQGEDQNISEDSPETVSQTMSEWGTQFHYVA